MNLGQTLRFCAILLAAIFLISELHVSLAQPASLFVPLPDSQMNDASPDQLRRIRLVRDKPTTRSFQLIRINPDALKVDATTMALGSSEPSTALRRKITNRSPNDFTWFGNFATGGQAVLVVRDGDVTGHIEKGADVYRITPLGGGLHALVKVDPTKFPPEHRPGPLPVAPQNSGSNPEPTRPQIGSVPSKDSGPSAQSAPDTSPDGVQVDVFIAYTTAARTAYGGNMSALAQLAVDDANAAYTNSNANVSLRLVGTLEVNYTETTFDQALDDLTNGTGVFAAVQTQRNSTGADEVSLMLGLSDFCGLAWINSTATTAFTTVNYDCAVDNHSFAHETGHNFGARHDPATDSTNTPFAYGHGYIFGNQWRTIMSYPGPCGGCPRLQYFSNPSKTYLGNAMGTAASNDVARVHRERVATVAAFRSPVVVPTLSVSPSTNISSTGSVGGPFTPSSFQYQLSSTSGSVAFSISGIPTWLTASFTSGTATTSPVTVTFSVNSNANTLAVNVYNATISFTNTTNNQGNTTRDATLTVGPVGPPNDNFANATVVAAGQTSLAGTNVGATKQSGEPNLSFNAGGKSVWWKCTASVSGTATVDTIGSNFDTILGVFTGSAVNALTLIASDDDNGGNFTSRVSFTAAAGAIYSIMVDGFSAASGNIQLHLAGLGCGVTPLTLSVTAASAIVASGPQGGPFALPSFQYQLVATTGSINFSISGVPSWLTASSTTGTATTSPTTVTFTVNGSANSLASAAYGPSTISFTNTTNGQGNTTRGASIVVNPRACEAVARLPEFSADGKSDIAWQNDNGTIGVWLLNGIGFLSAATVGSEPGGWRLVATGDLNGDGHSDMIFRHSSGALGVWFLNGTSVLSATTIATVGTDWHVIGVADLNGDGKGDILWRHDSGAVGAWIMNGASVLLATTIATVDNQWRLIGTGDINGDGKADLLWRHDSGTIGAWLLNGTSVISAGNLGSAPSDWRVVGIGDLNGDGRSDILWRSNAGVVGVWFLNGISVFSAANIATVGNDWHLAGAGDLNADGRADILWRHDSGTIGAWLMNGTTILSAGNIASATSDWHIVNGEHDRPLGPIPPGPC